MALPPIVRIASLCSGGGGLDLGVARALARLGRSHRAVVYAEREAYAAAVLAARIEEGALAVAPVWADLVSLDGEQLRGAVDLVVAGVPCQGNSIAGKRRGRADERWLWPHVERILAAAQPTWFFLENVRGLLSVDRGAAFGDILASLACLGFDAEWCLLRASDVGAPHRRERVFLLAHAEGLGVDLRARQERKHLRFPAEESAGVADAERSRLAGRPDERSNGRAECAPIERSGCVAVANAIGIKLRHESGRRSGTDGQSAPESRDAVPFPPGPDDADGWRDYLARFPDCAPAESTFRRGADGMAAGLVDCRADRLRLLGNGVVPAQAEAAFIHLYERITNVR